jgi:hypothetical protein
VSTNPLWLRLLQAAKAACAECPKCHGNGVIQTLVLAVWTPVGYQLKFTRIPCSDCFIPTLPLQVLFWNEVARERVRLNTPKHLPHRPRSSEGVA